jgi:glycosyltransferase involved in cell wall biosynthesis
VDRPIVLNGRAAARGRISGVERLAREVISRLPVISPGSYVVATPPQALAHRAGHAWEQLALPAHARRLHAAAIYSPANVAPLLSPRNVVVLHDVAVLRHPEYFSRAYSVAHRLLEAACARRAHALVTVSEFSRREIAELLAVSPERITVIPNGVDARFAPDVDTAAVRSAYRIERPYVLTVATADARKNLTLLATVARALRARQIDLLWAGASRRHLSGGAEPDGVRQLGYVPEQHLPALYAGAAAFVLPSRYEGFGLTCLEAMACGTPVVAADRTALPETCGDAALLIDPDDEDAFVAAVLTACTAQSTGDTLTRAGLARAREFSWERTAERTDELLRRVRDGSI